MADHHYLVCLIGAMDHLWFKSIVLFSEPTSVLPKTLRPLQTTSLETLTGHSSSPSSDEEISSPPPPDEQNLSSHSLPVIITTPRPLGNSNNEDEEIQEKEMKMKKRPTRLHLISGRTRSHSSAPSTQKRQLKSSTHSYSMITLQKTMSCRSLWELELEEVKGFMDLGFIFKKEQLTPRMMSVVPGLQRVGLNKQNPEEQDTGACNEIAEDDENEQEEYEKGIMRPYLSEAWLIKRPDSPLLNLRIPRVSASTDMKKHLRFWAKTVASEVHQEC